MTTNNDTLSLNSAKPLYNILMFIMLTLYSEPLNLKTLTHGNAMKICGHCDVFAISFLANFYSI